MLYALHNGNSLFSAVSELLYFLCSERDLLDSWDLCVWRIGSL